MPCKKCSWQRKDFTFFTLQITAYKESYYKWNFIVLQKYFYSSTKKNFGCTFFYNAALTKGNSFVHYIFIRTCNANRLVGSRLYNLARTITNIGLFVTSSIHEIAQNLNPCPA